MSVFTKTILYTAPDGRARWREESIALAEGKPFGAFPRCHGQSRDRDAPGARGWGICPVRNWNRSTPSA